ncbi:zinc finger protein 782-like [Galleria mellonella]|uniref:Zinc finger protein 782-like n=1 Tax=Galleria mellonella TaxID=7137 RepID=A0ABM3MWB7_GALME|nr:zinc finger protein 782-like [Galleria mellonella]
MNFSSVCRTCLSKSSLNSIFVNSSDHARYSLSIYISTGVKIEFNDGLPQNMCTECINFLNSYLKFRKKCKEAEIVLLKLKLELDNAHNGVALHHTTESSIVTNNDDETVATETERIDRNSELKNDEITNVLEDEDDKPLKYLIENILCDTIDAEHVDSKEIYLEITETDNEMKELTETTEIDVNEVKQAEIIDQPYDVIFSAGKKKRVICKLCQKDLSVRSIDTHMARSHPGADKRKVKCDLCDSYVLKEKMNRHRVLMHGSACSRCGYCKSEFENRELLVEHVATCTAKKRKRKANDSGRELTECDVCHKTMQRASLRMHKAVKHAGLGPVCEHCGKKFGNKFRLNEHYRAKHGYEKFKCSYCDFQSAAIMGMRNHERRHRGEKPFVCESCGAGFHAARLLAQHQHSHRTHRSLTCPQCPATFKAASGLQAHRRACHGGRAARCGLCGRVYRCRHYAARHLRRVHGTKA